MSSANRGGLTLKTGKIGRVNCLRQNLLMPGENMNIRLNGSCRLESLRERDVLRINAHLGVFMTPLRWLWPEFPDYLKEGPDNSIVMPMSTASNLSKYGIGSFNSGADSDDFPRFYREAYQRVYNEWYKWPEDPDITTDINEDGEKAVPLQKPWSRSRTTATPSDSADYTLPTANNEFDVRNLAETQARFRSAMKRDVLSYNRYMELLQEMYGADASREVDQVPIMLDQVEVGVNPREIPATDGASLGQWQSLYDFGIDHTIRGVTAPEHCVITYMLTVRFAAVTESKAPLASDRLDWYTICADPEYLAAAQPKELLKRHYFHGKDNTFLGYLPAGWEWRCDHDVIGKRVDERDSFPMMRPPNTLQHTKDATRVVDAFRSQSLGDYLVDCYITETSRQPLANAMDSFFSGMTDHVIPSRRSKSEFPKQGKML